MIQEMPITEAREKLTALPERFAKDPAAVTVTRRGKPVLAIMPWELYESLLETLEVMGDPDLMKTLRQGIREMQSGKAIPWEKAKKKLGL